MTQIAASLAGTASLVLVRLVPAVVQPPHKTGVPVSRDPVIASSACCADGARRQRPPTLAPPPSYRPPAPVDRPELIYSARQKQSGRHLGASGTSGRAGASGGGVNGAHTAATDGWSKMGRLTTATGPLAISIAEHRIEPHGLIMMRTS